MPPVEKPPSEPVSDVTDDLAAADAALAKADAALAEAQASGRQYRIGPAADLRDNAAATVARLRGMQRDAERARRRAAWMEIEREDEQDAKQLATALTDHVAPIVKRMRERWDTRQAAASSVGLLPAARHREVFAAFWTGLSG